MSDPLANSPTITSPAAAPAAPGTAPAPNAAPSAPPAFGTPPAGGAEPSSPGELTDDQIAKLFDGRDPFAFNAPEPTEKPPAAQPPAQGAQPPPAEKPAENVPPAPGAAAPAGEGKTGTSEQALTQAVSALTETVATLKAPADQGNQPDPYISAYNAYDVPDALMTAMASEDLTERKRGVKALMQGVSQTVHANLRRELAQTVPYIANQLIQQASAMQEIRSDLFGTHKDLARPELRQLVQGVAQAAFAELQPKGWNPQFRDEIARRVYAILGRAPTNGATPPAPQPAPPVQFGGSTRPAAPPPGSSQEQAMMDLLLP